MSHQAAIRFRCGKVLRDESVGLVGLAHFLYKNYISPRLLLHELRKYPKLTAMKVKSIHSIATLSLLLLITAGCEIGDNQLIVPLERFEIANPTPTSRDFQTINSHHKILMAIIDYGVDYNHPELKNNLHFSLDQEGQAIGLGHDFVGNDQWPSPILAMTADTDPEASLEAKAQALNLNKHIQLLLNAYPQLEKIISPYQRIDQESDSGSFHGTHVAGLMTYDSPELGLTSYRVLPVNQIFKAGEVQQSQMGQMPVSKSVMQSLEMAAQNGVKVINMSFAMVLKIDENPEGSQEYNDFFAVYKLFSAFVNNHPEITFVAASGNSGGYIDAKNYKQLPCGLNAPNVLCVGALNKEGRRASFTNVTIKSPFILAPAVDILSLAPLKTCRLINDNMDINQSSDMTLNDLNSPWNNESQTKQFLADLASVCLSNNGYLKATGTSMASPIIARAIAKIRLKYPELNGAESITKLLSMGDKIKEGDFTFTRIKVEKPSWYSLAQNAEKLTDPFFIQKYHFPFDLTKYFEFNSLSR